MSDRSDGAVTQTKIANDMLRYLRNNRDVCAWLSIHAGHHPYVRWDGDHYVVAENMGYGEVEVQYVSGQSLINKFAENPIDLIPVEKPTDGNGDPLWDVVDENGEQVTVVP